MPLKKINIFSNSKHRQELKAVFEETRKLNYMEKTEISQKENFNWAEGKKQRISQ